jgi:hypothetical protein
MHHLVYVAGEDPDEVLAPYDEEGAAEFFDQTNEVLYSYLTKKIASDALLVTSSSPIEIVDGRFVEVDVGVTTSLYTESGFDIEKLAPGIKLILKQSLTEEWTSVEVTKRDGTRVFAELIPEKDLVFPASVYTLKQFAEMFYPHLEVVEDDEMSFGYFYNPVGRYDYYRIGGEWQGMLKLKEPKEGKPMYVNSAAKKDIDWSDKSLMTPYAFVSKACGFVILQEEDRSWKFRKFQDFYDRFIAPLPEDEIITVVDCHE